MSGSEVAVGEAGGFTYSGERAAAAVKQGKLAQHLFVY